jgi:hypothetical protein
MASKSVKLTIDINQSDLEAEKLEELTQNLLQEMKERDEVETASLVADENPPEGAKTWGRFLLGILQAEVSIENISFVLEFLWDSLNRQPIEIKVETNGNKFEIVARDRHQLLVAIDAVNKLCQLSVAIDASIKLLESAEEDKNG